MRTYRIIQAPRPPGDDIWWCIVRQASTDVMNVQEVSRHPTEDDAKAALAELERHDAEARL